MAFTFKNLGHFFAVAFRAIEKDLPKVAADVAKLQATAPIVEGVTAAAGQAQFIPVEDAAFAALGAVSAALTAGGDAAAAKLADAGLDVTAVQKVQAVVAAVPHVVAVAKSVNVKADSGPGSNPPPPTP